MRNGIVWRSRLELFNCMVIRLAGQEPQFSPERKFFFKNPLESIQRTILGDIEAGKLKEIAEFACHPEHALHLYLAGHLTADALENQSVETRNSIAVDLQTGLPEFPMIRLVILSPEAFDALHLPRNASGATRNSKGEVIW